MIWKLVKGLYLCLITRSCRLRLFGSLFGHFLFNILHPELIMWGEVERGGEGGREGGSREGRGR